MIYCPCVLYYNIQLTKLGNFPAVCLPVPKTVTESQRGRDDRTPGKTIRPRKSYCYYQ